jgi:SAM-dependent methyltransferase
LEEHLRGASIVHLQCSHGRDGLSLLSLGAANLVGVDVSAERIRQAATLSEAMQSPARWICADVLAAPADLDATADLVYTGKGSLPWIMDINAWAGVVHRLLKPGGRVYLLEGHPLDNLWDRTSGSLRLRDANVSYFDEVPRENAGFPATALNRAHAERGRPRMRERFWRPDQVLAALTAAGLVFESYREHPDLFWDQFPEWPDDLKGRLPHTYSVRYRKLG